MAKKQKSKKSARVKKDKKAPNVAPSTPNIWERQSLIVRHSVCLALLLAVSFSFFAPIHFQGKSLFAYDTISFKAMANGMLEFEEETGEKPLWSPNAFGGMPGYMIYFPLDIKQADDIARELRKVIWPSSHLIFLFFGMYFLAFYLVKDHWASLLAAIGYGLTTYIPVILMAGHNSKFVTMAFAPWLLWAFIYALRKPGLKGSLLFAIAMAVNLRAGHIQITYYVSFLMGIWWLVEVVSALRTGRQKEILMSTLWLAFGSILSLLMVAQPFLSNFEYKEYSIRGAAPGSTSSGLSWEYAMRWSQGFGELTTLLISDAYGGADAYWGLKPGTGGPHYIGSIVLVFALLASFTIRKRAVLALSITAFIMVLFSLGEYFELLNRPMFNFFPLFSSFRVPETWLSIVAMILALLSAFGLKAVFSHTRQQGVAFPSSLRAVAAGVAVILLFLVAKNAFFDFERPNEVQLIAQQIAMGNNVPVTHPQVMPSAEQFVSEIKTERSDRFTDDAVRSLLFLLGAGLLLFLYRREQIPAFVAGLLILSLVTIDLYGVGKRYFNEDDLSEVDTADELVQEYGFDTFLIDKKEALGGNGHFRVLSLIEGDPQTTARPSYHYESLGGYHGAKLRLYQDFLENILFTPSRMANENGLDLMNVRYVVDRAPFPGGREVYRDPQTGAVVTERPQTPGRAYFVGEAEYIPDPEATWSRLQDPQFSLAETAIVHDEAAVATVPIDSSSVVSAELHSHSPKEIRWTVNTDANRLLVISELYYPAGWKATLDGEDVDIHRVNYMLRGIQVPAGSHELVMSFDPSSYRTGYLMTLLSTLFAYGGLAVMLGLGYYRQREKAQPTSDVS